MNIDNMTASEFVEILAQRTDKYGNETGDSIDLSPCDYLLSAIELEDLTIADIEVQVYD